MDYGGRETSLVVNFKDDTRSIPPDVFDGSKITARTSSRSGGDGTILRTTHRPDSVRASNPATLMNRSVDGPGLSGKIRSRIV